MLNVCIGIFDRREAADSNLERTRKRERDRIKEPEKEREKRKTYEN